MKAISLWQPWATLIALGAKRIETRSWETLYRGPLLIHAAKRKPREYQLDRSAFDRWHVIEAPPPWCEVMPLGCIVAIATLADCRLTQTIEEAITEMECAFGNFAPGRFAWYLKDIRRLEWPHPVKGARGLFDVDARIGPYDGDESVIEVGGVTIPLIEVEAAA